MAASMTRLPVLGVPVESKTLGGLDSLQHSASYSSHPLGHGNSILHNVVPAEQDTDGARTTLPFYAHRLKYVRFCLHPAVAGGCAAETYAFKIQGNL